MTELDIYQVDAFASELFKGNPAAVVPLNRRLHDSVLQNIAAENNLAETAFFIDRGDCFDLRWFTPAIEVDLCGHATLATSHVLFSELGFDEDQIIFKSRSGDLRVTRVNEKLQLDFPSDPVKSVIPPAGLLDALGTRDRRVYQGVTDFMVVLDSESEVAALNPDFKALKAIGARGVICTAPGDNVDFISRFFAPGVGIDEDPVTGSAHTTLTPYWSGKLGKTELTALQISPRGGQLWCTHKSDRVLIAGNACTYMKGTINLL